ncbi:xylose isomerase XylA [Clostridium aceticum]|uniref:Xylose isomerase n=1 Tax=Clostridium aceticum TaxID=84022 RepID=A0A0D8I8E8_9CLOT|nr:xylose isomerase [Clostridium aceticum]AKL97308.1 xylose isomerase XylA [Clostridium aceticum]KJF26324.1 xylose isomerase [Clostridium aceticum]
MREYFAGMHKIKFEGKDSTNPLAFKYYDANRIVAGKKMKDHFRFALSYWHTLTGDGNDPFGQPTMERSYDGLEGMALSKARVEAAFELMTKLGIEFFCFHDLDIAPEGSSLQEKLDNLDVIVELIEEKMKETDIKCLWGTTNAFGHPRFMHGAATSPNAEVFAFAAAQVKKVLEITHRLGGENYVFWGGREGYETLLNTDVALENDNLAKFLRMAKDYGRSIGFKGQFLIEPKPKEPTKHQYDYDTMTVLGFLRKYNLIDDFKLNIEANHATLAGHTFQHELALARINGVLGSIDANQGDMLLGWDTDQFPTNIYDTTMCMYEVLKNGGIAPGGLNFDAKVRRGSFKPEDLFIAYIVGMDTFAKGLLVAEKLLSDGVLENFMKNRYASYTVGIGKKIVEDATSFQELAEYALKHDKIVLESGRQEMLEDIVNQYIYRY